MSVGVMKDYKLSDLRASHTIDEARAEDKFTNFVINHKERCKRKA